VILFGGLNDNTLNPCIRFQTHTCLCWINSSNLRCLTMERQTYPCL